LFGGHAGPSILPDASQTQARWDIVVAMSNRREFIAKAAGAAAGIAFTGCGLSNLSGAPQQASASRRRLVSVGGRRIKTIDIHAHCAVPEAAKLVGEDVTIQDAPLENRLKAMDAEGIDMQALSINAFWYGAERDVVTRLIQMQNEKLAELCAAHPDRFVAFASVALQFPELAAQQLEDGVKKLGLRGAAIGGHVNGDELSNPKFDPFWRKAEELGVLIFMHPQGVPELAKRFAGNGRLGNAIGNPLETTIFLSHLIFDGTLDRYPGLKICGAHGGGYLPSYADRSDHVCAAGAGCDAKPLKKHPTEYLRREIFADSLIFAPEALRHLVAQCGPSQIMIGTDYPFPWTTTPVDHVLSTPGLSNADKRAILGENAARLLRIGA
jgi:aminocarboxymuconate-semialdehyde decarboxylase